MVRVPVGIKDLHLSELVRSVFRGFTDVSGQPIGATLKKSSTFEDGPNSLPRGVGKRLASCAA
jgi:hypothetical protein